MRRSLIPLLLASLGFLMIRFVVNMPLFEWQISEIVIDLPSTYEVDIHPSPWIAYPRDSLHDGSYILRYGVQVTRDGHYCSGEDLKFIVSRSENYDIVERVLNAHQEMSNSSWLFRWVVIELIFSTIYVWWFIIGYKHGKCGHVVVFTGLAVFIHVFLLIFSRIIGPHIGYAGTIDCSGTIAFTARLSKVHYETLIVVFAIFLSELGALAIMARQIIKAIVERKSASNLQKTL